MSEEIQPPVNTGEAEEPAKENLVVSIRCKTSAEKKVITDYIKARQKKNDKTTPSRAICEIILHVRNSVFSTFETE